MIDTKWRLLESLCIEAINSEEITDPLRDDLLLLLNTLGPFVPRDAEGPAIGEQPEVQAAFQAPPPEEPRPTGADPAQPALQSSAEQRPDPVAPTLTTPSDSQAQPVPVGGTTEKLQVQLRGDVGRAVRLIVERLKELDAIEAHAR